MSDVPQRMVGCRLVPTSPPEQVRLDRFVAELMRREARAQRYVRGARRDAPIGGNRRAAYRVPVRDAELVAIAWVRIHDELHPEARLDPIGPLTVYDISAIGCGLDWPADTAPGIGDEVELQLVGDAFFMELRAKVVRVVQRG
jgi:hypothetical protein